MPASPHSPPRSRMDAPQVLDTYFLELRGKLLEIAATLDRIDRAADADRVAADPRLEFTRQALAILQHPPTAGEGRAERLLRLYSKP